MRMILKASIPVESGNDMIRSGQMPNFLQGILADLKPEAVYFYPEDG